jgi:hypothetical protein
MSDTGDPYYFEKQCRWTAATQMAIPVRKVPYVTQANQRRRRRFVLVPWEWKERLCKARYATTSDVALHVLHRNYETRGKPFTLANGVLGELGVSRNQKRRALVELEQLGLITVEWREKKSPVITVLLVPTNI